MGAVSTLFLLDVGMLRGRVLPTLRRWISTGATDAWWTDALHRTQAPAPVPADRAAWQAGEPGGPGWSSGRPTDLLPEPRRTLDEDTLRALEVAVLAATVGDGLAFGNARWLSVDLVDPDDGVLDEAPAAGSQLLDLIERLDDGLQHLRLSTGGYGEGLRGALDEAGTAELDRELAALGSLPADGGPPQIRGAMAARPAEPAHRQAARTTLLGVHSMAHRASLLGLGLLHGRDLTLDGMGSWQSGVFLRDPGAGAEQDRRRARAEPPRPAPPGSAG